MNTSRGSVAIALLALTLPARARGATSVNVSVDATVAGAPLERVWAFHGYDEINYTTLPEGAALLATIAGMHSAPAHIRSHFLLNTGDGTPALKWGSTNVYTEDEAGNPSFDFTLTDAILDTVTRAGAFPLVELGFMPQALSTHPLPYRNSSTTALNGGCFYPPSDYTKWAELIRAWALHAQGRYPEVAASWLWELWNEPDGGYWHGTFEDYAALYDYTEAALHDVLPSAPLGGPAVATPEASFLTQFLEHCATGTNAVTGARGTRLDLVSFHAKGGVGLAGGHVEMDLGNQLRLHQKGFAAVAAFPAFAAAPIYITEADPDGCAACPASTAPENAYRNSPAYGAYELATMKHTLELEALEGVNLGGVLTWAFTFPGSDYFAGYRALTTNGISLPVLSAFKLLGQLAGVRLPVVSSGAHSLDDLLMNGVRAEPEIDGMAALDGTAIRILLWNYHDDIVPAAPAPVHLAVTVPASFGASARVSHLRVDESHGDAYSVWVTQGMPASPSPDQVAQLEHAMDPAPLVADATLAVEHGSVSIDFELPRFGVSLLTVEPGGNGGGVDPGGAGGSAAGAASGPEPGGAGCACRQGERADAKAPIWSLEVVLMLGARLVRRSRARRRPATLMRRLHVPT